MPEVIRFAIVGTSNTAMTWTIFFILAGWARIDAVVSNVLAWTVSTCWSFYWNRRFTFRATGGQPPAEALRFIAVNLSAITVSSAIIALLRNHPLIFAQSAATAATFGWNYLMCRYVVFGSARRARELQR